MKELPPYKQRITESTEPLIELLYQEFPNKDPQEIERIIKTMVKWLEQRIKDIKEFKIMLKQKGEDIDIDPLHDAQLMELMQLIRFLKSDSKEHTNGQ